MFFPNKTVAGNDKDLIWVNKKIRSKINFRNKLYKIYINIVKMNMIFQILKILSPSVATWSQQLKPPMNILGEKLNDPTVQTNTGLFLKLSVMTKKFH